MHDDPAATGDATPPPPSAATSLEAWRELLPEAVTAGGAVPWLAASALDHVGDPDGERVDLLAGRPVLVPRLALGHLRLTGADRVAFLHGLVSHDVAGLSEGAAIDALLLDHRGQPRAGLSVTRRRDDLFVAVDDGAGEAVRQVLFEHVIFDRVEVEALDRRLATATFVDGAFATPSAHERGAGRPAAATLGAALEAAWPGAAAALETALREPEVTASVPTPAGRALLRARRFGPGWAVDVHVLAEDLSLAGPSWLTAGVRPVGERAFTAGRVAFGVASALGEGRLGLPQETGLEGRVSYRKGCYLGQEIMARVEARGRLRRGLRTLRLDGPPPGLGSAQAWRVEDAAGRSCGVLGSAAPAPDGDGWRALAVVRLDVEDGGPWRVVVDGAEPRFGPAATAAAPLRATPSG
jgi:tRNA-modifying protein YgfZ